VTRFILSSSSFSKAWRLTRKTDNTPNAISPPPQQEEEENGDEGKRKWRIKISPPADDTY
jgi:hypothetical protein